MTNPGFRRVPAIDTCFAILEAPAQSKAPMGTSDISGRHDLKKSAVFKRAGLDVRAQAIACDRGEYSEGMVALAIPVTVYGREVQPAIRAVGLTREVADSFIPELTQLLKGICEEEISYRLQ
jgi:hypothetical protein